MKYLKTKLATCFPKSEGWKHKVLETFLFFIPKANPDYEKKMHLIKSWLIEFLENEGEILPWREIALDENNNPLFAGPDKRNYGFWLDTNMKYEDFDGIQITKEEFEHYWKISGVKELEI